MEKIGLLIDSTSLTREDLKDYDFLKCAQLKVEFDEKAYDEKNLSKADMERALEAGKKFLTSQPSPAEFFNIYKDFFDNGYTHVIVIVLSHKISGTYQSALIGKSMIDFNIEVDVYSPNSASFGVALGVKQIAEAIKSGIKYKGVTEKYHSLFAEPLVVFTLGDLKNLLRGGRLNKVQALIGTILRVKPIIEMIDGKLDLVKKERTNIACLEYFIQKIDYYTKKYKTVYLDIIYLHMEEWGEKLLEIVKTNYKSVQIHTTDYLTPVFYSHLGNKGFGIAIVAE